MLLLSPSRKVSWACVAEAVRVLFCGAVANLLQNLHVTMAVF